MFSGRYKDGIRRLRALEKRSGFNELFLYSYGILYDHLAMAVKNRARRSRLEEKARSYYLRAVKLGVGGVKPYWGLGRILLHNKKYKPALEYYRKAYNMRPASRSTRLAYATALSWAERYREARKLFEADRRKYGRGFRTSFNLADIENKIGNKKRAGKYALEALRFWRRNKRHRSRFGKLWEENLKRLVVQQS